MNVKKKTTVEKISESEKQLYIQLVSRKTELLNSKISFILPAHIGTDSHSGEWRRENSMASMMLFLRYEKQTRLVQCKAFVCIAGDTDWNSIVRWHYRTHRLYSQRKEYESTWLSQKNGQKRSGCLKVDDRIPEFDSPLYCRTVNGIGRAADSSDEIVSKFISITRKYHESFAYSVLLY